MGKSNKINKTELTQDAIKNFKWLVEFSKKVVFWAFILYVVGTLFIMALLYMNLKNGDTTGFETFIIELNTTFKLVVGGYVIKAAIENAIKIGGSKYQEFIKVKYDSYKSIVNNDDNDQTINNIENSQEVQG